MCSPKTVNSIGLLFDIIGVLLIYFYGLPNRAAEKLRWESDLEKEKKLKHRSIWGLIFIGIGFVLQLISNYL